MITIFLKCMLKTVRRQCISTPFLCELSWFKFSSEVGFFDDRGQVTFNEIYPRIHIIKNIPTKLAISKPMLASDIPNLFNRDEDQWKHGYHPFIDNAVASNPCRPNGKYEIQRSNGALTSFEPKGMGLRNNITAMNVALSFMFAIYIAAAITKPTLCSTNVVNKRAPRNNSNLNAFDGWDVRKYTIDT